MSQKILEYIIRKPSYLSVIKNNMLDFHLMSNQSALSINHGEIQIIQHTFGLIWSRLFLKKLRIVKKISSLLYNLNWQLPCPQEQGSYCSSSWGNVVKESCVFYITFHSHLFHDCCHCSSFNLDMNLSLTSWCLALCSSSRGQILQSIAWISSQGEAFTSNTPNLFTQS